MKGWLTEDTGLIQILVSRSEIDMEISKQDYETIQYLSQLHHGMSCSTIELTIRPWF